MITIFHLHWAVYFDDFFLVAEVHEAGHVKMAQSLLFLLIGWETSSEKEAEFDAILRALGVQINLAEVSLGAITVCNVESRVKELVTSIDAILGKGVLSSADAKVLRGRMVFAEAQVFGRLAGIHMKQLTRYEQSIGDSAIDDELRRGLIFLRDRVVTGGPRRVLAKLGRTFHLCTDASFEQGSGGLGRVLYDEWGKMLSFFAEPVSASLIQLLNPEGKQTIIFELEALAVLVGSTCLLDPIAS